MQTHIATPSDEWAIEYQAMKEEARSLVSAIEFMAGKSHPLARKARRRREKLIFHSPLQILARLNFQLLQELMNKTTDTIDAPEF